MKDDNPSYKFIYLPSSKSEVYLYDHHEIFYSYSSYSYETYISPIKSFLQNFKVEFLNKSEILIWTRLNTIQTLIIRPTKSLQICKSLYIHIKAPILPKGPLLPRGPNLNGTYADMEKH